MIPEKKKQLLSNSVTDDRILIDVNELHPEKAYPPITETEDGMTIDDNEVHLRKA